MYTIYLIQHKESGKTYIGQSKVLAHRWQTHRRSLNQGHHHCSHLQHAWNKYGEDAFEFFSIKENLTEEEANTLEKEMIEWFAELELAYNPLWRHLGRGEVSEETRKKLSERNKKFGIQPPSRKGIPLSEDAKEKAKQTRLVNAKPKKQKFCACGTEINLWATYCKICFKAHISKLTKARGLTEEQKQSLRIRRIGTTMSQESKDQISKSLKGRMPNNFQQMRTIREKSFRVISPEGEIFKSKNISKFCREHKLDRHLLGKLVNGKILKYKGWQCEDN